MSVQLMCVLDPEFFEARAIVFSKMGQHRQALEIYVFKIEDYAKAEEYVQSCPCSNPSDKNQAYTKTDTVTTST